MLKLGGILAVTDYDGDLRDLLTRWKFSPSLSLSRSLTRVMQLSNMG